MIDLTICEDEIRDRVHGVKARTQNTLSRQESRLPCGFAGMHLGNGNPLAEIIWSDKLGFQVIRRWVPFIAHRSH